MDIDGGNTGIPIPIRSGSDSTAQEGALDEPVGRDPLARSRFVPSTRVVVYVALAVVVVAVGGYAGKSALNARSARAERHRIAAVEAATTDVQTVIARYRLPSSVTAFDLCDEESLACGSSTKPPRAALGDVVGSFASLGISGGATDCTSGTSSTCWSDLVFRGSPVGGVRTSREDVSYRIFGEPTSVDVHFGSPADFEADPGRATVSNPSPITDRAVAFSGFPAGTSASATCSRNQQGGCAAFSAKGTSAVQRDALWARTGRALVANGWRDVSGHCDPTTPRSPCTIRASRARAARGDLDLGIRLTPHGSSTRIAATVRSMERITVR